ncbi:hypothetical protein JHK87_001836 [Glycine soja]|nr:hypothetical protein JHK87_001836 [Glycine soja]
MRRHEEERRQGGEQTRMRGRVHARENIAPRLLSTINGSTSKQTSTLGIKGLLAMLLKALGSVASAMACQASMGQLSTSNAVASKICTPNDSGHMSFADSMYEYNVGL